MKFGENYYLHQIPGWTQSYCNYDKLKGALRVLAESTSPEEKAKLGECKLAARLIMGNSLLMYSPAFDSYAKDEIEIVEQAFSKRLASLRLRVAKTWRLYGISPELQGQSFRDVIAKMNYQEICHLFSCSYEQYQSLEHLQNFAKVNSLAFSRILEKTQRVSEEIYKSMQQKLIDCSFFHQVEILSHIYQLKGRLEDLKGARNSLGGTTKEFYILKSVLANQGSGGHDLQGFHTAIHEDRPERIIAYLNGRIGGATPFPWDFQTTDTLVRAAIWSNSFSVAYELIKFIGSKPVFLKFNRKLIHELLEELGKQKMENSNKEKPLSESRSSTDRSVSPFLAILDQLDPSQHAAFTTVDDFGRIPLHYAALYGLLVEYQAILAKMEEWGCFKMDGSTYFTLQDTEGSTPLELATANGHHEIVDATLQCLTKLDHKSDAIKPEVIIEMVQNSLLAAIVQKDLKMVLLLLKEGVSQDKSWKNNESFLYIAARLGCIDIVRALVTNFSNGEKLDTAETAYGWTPLIVACARGFEEIAKTLAEAGADQELLDFRGFNAKENAVFRGHVQLAAHLKDQGISPKAEGQGIKKSSSNLSQDLRNKLNDGKNIILINPGTLDLTKQVAPVNFTTPKASIPYPESIYSIEVGLLDSAGPSYSLNLPLLEDLTNKPWYFVSQDAHDLKLEFKIFRATETLLEKGELVGSAIAILRSKEPKLGPNNDSIIKETTVPLHERHTLQYMGTITFTYLVLTPPRNPRINTTPRQDAWKDTGSVKVVGHRGWTS
ncbi:Glycerophosphocholine phosphodiesterase [Orbilia ellipsospora]|uniref:Glycerophosphocholine phosphodiesterase n=1 Tax=Orbilia ellipsospora TaxID=2528407 RepID=A0AAV9WRT4_9PEZI